MIIHYYDVRYFLDLFHLNSIDCSTSLMLNSAIYIATLNNALKGREREREKDISVTNARTEKGQHKHVCVFGGGGGGGGGGIC